MEANHSNHYKVLIFAIIHVFILSIAHFLNSKLIMLIPLLLFLAMLIFLKKHYFFPLMLFYLPWSPLLKFAPGTLTFYTIAVPLVFLFVIIEGGIAKEKYNLPVIITTLLFIVYCLVIKFMYGYMPERRFLFFMIMLFFIPLYMKRYKEKIEFETCSHFLVAGVITACIASSVLVRFPHMFRYIDVYEWERMGLTRLSGFYGDANFYAVHILLAITTILIILRNVQTIRSMLVYVTCIFALIYFGMLSVSKMFLICLSILLFIWLLLLLFERTVFTYKVALWCMVICITAIVFGSGLFLERIEQYVIRFSLASDSESFTTGRSTLIDMYIVYLFSSVKHFLFGIGLTPEYVNGRSSHNTFVQLFYQLGVIGLLIILAWWRITYKICWKNVKLRGMNHLYFLLILVATFFPWLALEMVYFDEFFYMTLLVFFARYYLSKNESIDKKTTHKESEYASQH